MPIKKNKKVDAALKSLANRSPKANHAKAGTTTRGGFSTTPTSKGATKIKRTGKEYPGS